MARFHGFVGYNEGTVETPAGSGVWVDVMVEFKYYGDVTQNIRRLESTEKINDDITVQTSISIVADAYAMEHFFALKYVQWEGQRWTVSSVNVQRPRLILSLGSVYNGPIPTP